MNVKACKTCKRLLPRATCFSKYASGGRLAYKAVCNECIATADARRLAARRARCVPPPDMRETRLPIEDVFATWARQQP